MNAADTPFEREIADAAASWVARSDAGLNAQERAELAAWQQADPRHAAAFDRFQCVWSAADRPRAAGVASTLRAQLSARARQRRARRTATLAAGLLLGVVTIFGVRAFVAAQRPAALPATAQTTYLGPERRTLPDGSIAEYSRGTELTLDFSGPVRRVTFDRGQAHFTVVPDPARPFIVSAGGVAIRAVGTAFAVQSSAGQTEVIVTHGKVAVDTNARATGPGPAPDPLAFVTAGQAVAVTTPAAAPASVQPLSDVAVVERLAWRRSRAEFSRVPLADVIAVVNRHAQARFSIEDEALARVPLSGVFRIDDAEEFAQVLEAGFGVSVERSEPGKLLLRRR